MSISKEIKINYKWDKETALKSFNDIYKFEFNKSTKKYFGWFIIALVQFGVVATLKKGDITLLAFSTILLIYWYFIKKLIAKKRFLDTIKDIKNINLAINKNGITFNKEKITWKWDEISEIKELESGFIIIKDSNHFFLPKEAFKTNKELESFIQFIK